MAKGTGLGHAFLFSGLALSNDIQGASWNSPHQTLDSTGINMFANERLLGLKDGQMSVAAFFNPAAGAAHDTLSALPTTDQLMSYLVGTTLGGQVANLVARQVNYDGTRGPDGSLMFAMQGVGDGYPVEWGRQLTAGQALLGGAAAGSGVDTTASASFGLQAWLHVGLFTGTSATVTLQDFTADTPASYTDITGGAFAPATAIGWQRIQTSRTQTVRRWVRVNVTGTFSALVFAVGFEKNLQAANF